MIRYQLVVEMVSLSFILFVKVLAGWNIFCVFVSYENISDNVSHNWHEPNANPQVAIMVIVFVFDGEETMSGRIFRGRRGRENRDVELEGARATVMDNTESTETERKK